MNYAVIKKFDIANGPGVRVSLFVSGCRHFCKNCFNSEAWDFNFGEPFEPENQEGVLSIVKRIKTLFPEKSIWIYTGFLFDEQLLKGTVGSPETVKEILKYTDVLVDGKFIEELKSPDLLFRGSSNQRIIDVEKSLTQGKTVWLEGKWERRMGSGNIYE